VIRIYFFFKRFLESASYRLSRPAKKKIVVLTFDDYVDENSIELAEYLKSRKISATFFLTLKQTKPGIIKNLVSLGHEVGGHSIDHSREERGQFYATASQCMSELKKYDSRVVSWRFPWTSKDERSVNNVASAGFLIDSSVGAFYPAKKAGKLMSMVELPWLRLPRQWQMDVNEKDYKVIKDYIIRKVSSESGIFVIGFHTYYQYAHFVEFKDLIENLMKMPVEFLPLREAAEVLKNDAL